MAGMEGANRRKQRPSYPGLFNLKVMGSQGSQFQVFIPPSSIFSLKTGCKASVSPVGHGSINLEPAGTESQICTHHVECALLDSFLVFHDLNTFEESCQVWPV